MRDMSARVPLPLAEVDLASTEFWNAGNEHREAGFATLRREAPVRFLQEFAVEGLQAGPGYWALTRYHDIVEASRRPDLFCSGRGTNIMDLPVEIAEFFGSMINMDDPKHARLRGIVQKGFTPRMVARVEGYVRDKARGLVDRALEEHPDGRCDFVQAFAAPLPLQIICEMTGIPAEDEQRIFSWTNVILGAGDPDYGGTYEHLMTTSFEIYAYAQALGEDRLANPRDDITSALMHAEVDGERLTAQEFGSFFILLVVAGNETTRNAISHGMKALTDFPDQRRAWWADTRRGRAARWRSWCAGRRRSSTSGARSRRTRRSGACRSGPARRSCTGTTRRTGTRTSSSARRSWTSRGTRTTTWGSARGARTSAWARAWPAARSR
jgi:methyl-branched lipid omega-hydroxylase